MTVIEDLPLDAMTRIAEMSSAPAEVAATCRFFRAASEATQKFDELEFEAPWIGKGTDFLKKTKTAAFNTPSEESSDSLVEWLRTRPNRGFGNVETVRATLHPTSFRPMTTTTAFARAFPNLRHLRLDASGSFDIPHEMVFPAKGFENLETFEAVLSDAPESCWLEVFAGYPRPPKLKSVVVRVV